MLGPALAAATSLGLSAGGWLQGPSLLPFGGPLVESLTAAAGGAVVGWLASRRHSTVPVVD
jgi:hypothetical protein